jgi:hypothetical protein
MGVVQNAISQRLSGERPSPLIAAMAASGAGGAVAVLVYRLLRS